MSDAKVVTQNGVTTCTFTVPETLHAVPPSESAAQAFELALKKYHLLLATGPVGNGAIQFHTYKIPSSDPIDMKASSLVGGAGEDWLVQVLPQSKTRTFVNAKNSQIDGCRGVSS